MNIKKLKKLGSHPHAFTIYMWIEITYKKGNEKISVPRYLRKILGWRTYEFENAIAWLIDHKMMEQVHVGGNGASDYHLYKILT